MSVSRILFISSSDAGISLIKEDEDGQTPFLAVLELAIREDDVSFVSTLKADPKTVDLRAQAPHFYTLGARIMDLFEDQDVLDTLVGVCYVRERGAI